MRNSSQSTKSLHLIKLCKQRKQIKFRKTFYFSGNFNRFNFSLARLMCNDTYFQNNVHIQRTMGTWAKHTKHALFDSLHWRVRIYSVVVSSFEKRTEKKQQRIIFREKSTAISSGWEKWNELLQLSFSSFKVVFSIVRYAALHTEISHRHTNTHVRFKESKYLSALKLGLEFCLLVAPAWYYQRTVCECAPLFTFLAWPGIFKLLVLWCSRVFSSINKKKTKHKRLLIFCDCFYTAPKHSHTHRSLFICMFFFSF